jgi:hypothetical protein
MRERLALKELTASEEAALGALVKKQLALAELSLHGDSAPGREPAGARRFRVARTRTRPPDQAVPA